MKKFLTITLTVALLAVSGCRQYDDSALWDEMNSQAARLAALEAWQATVNSNITALQGLVDALKSRSYIIDVEPFSTPAPGGWTIAFSTGVPVTIWNGAKGDTPQIGVAEEDGAYYWTLDGEWLLNGSGDKIPVTGEEGPTGQTPQLRINPGNNEWEVCTNGNCAADADWTSLGVKATGAKGNKGDRGDAIFAANGVKYYDDDAYDYVEFTLADGTTTIQVPKYRRPLGITFTQPAPFRTSETRHVGFTTTDNTATVKVLDVPAGWTVTAQFTKAAAAGTFTIIAPGSCASEGEAIILISDAAGEIAMHILKVTMHVYTPAGSTITFEAFDPCPAAATGTTWYLTDTREREQKQSNVQTYKVKKMADGHIWMVQDMKFGYKCFKTDFKGITSEQADNNLTDLPGYIYGNCTNKNNASTPSNRGFLYTWAAAIQIAGAFYSSTLTVGCSGTGSGTAGTNPGACRGICPEGWHLPTGGTSGEYQALHDAIGGCVTTNDNCWDAASAWAGVYGGYIKAGADLCEQNIEGYYWSSTYLNAEAAGTLFIVNNEVVLGTEQGWKHYGASVRCVKNY
jgi:uncharacterized protein (TIGR02145 family)